MPTEDREQQFERALARLLRDASPESHCPDAETLSAYHERSLREAEMAHWKEHISQCVRCQEILTLVEQSEEVQAEEWEKPEEPAGVYAKKTAELMSGAASQAVLQPAAKPATTAQTVSRISEMRSRPRWRWLIPVGALAACAIVAVGIREIQMQNRKEAAARSVPMAKNQELAPQATAPWSLPSGQQSMPQLNQQQRPAPALDKTTRDQKQAIPAVPRVPPPSAALAPEDAMVATSPTNDPARAPRREALANSARMAAPVAPVAPETSDLTAGDKDRNIAPAPAPSTVAGAAKKAAPQEQSARPLASQAAAVEVPGDTTTAETVSSQRALNNLLAASLLETAAADRRYIVAPGLKSVWRVGNAGKIERSTDRGKTWKEQSSGVTTDLTAGSATSEKICWVIGKSGTILLSVDGGKSWKQVASPISGDIGGIQATDALHASVWDVAKHVSYETSDGGGTWDRVANE
jgi:hypothetical protein